METEGGRLKNAHWLKLVLTVAVEVVLLEEEEVEEEDCPLAPSKQPSFVPSCRLDREPCIRLLSGQAGITGGS